jgi:arylsulfatase A-like enzyme
MPAVDGRSLWGNLTCNPDPGRPNETFSEHLGAMDGVPSRMIRRGPWKLYLYANSDPPVLFNLEDDPDELNDLYGNPEAGIICEDLQASVKADWAPVTIIAESLRLDEDLDVLKGWARATRAVHDESLAVPCDSEDVELL